MNVVHNRELGLKHILCQKFLFFWKKAFIIPFEKFRQNSTISTVFKVTFVNFRLWDYYKKWAWPLSFSGTQNRKQMMPYQNQISSGTSQLVIIILFIIKSESID